MSELGFKFQNIHYNAARSAFEALAFRTVDGVEHRLVCSFHAPISTSPTQAIHGLISDADHQCRHRPRLVMVHRPEPRAPRVPRAA